MEPGAWITLGIVVVVFVALARGLSTPDVVLLAGAIAVALLRIITPGELLRGFANEGMLTIAAMFVVAAGLRETGALDRIGRGMLGTARQARWVFARLAPQVTLMSAFVNNTAVVAMLLPVVSGWCRRHHVSPSRLLIPLSYVTLLGGSCTLIGTSTNLIVNGLMTQASTGAADTRVAEALRPLWFFEPAMVGVAAVVVGVAYLGLIGRRLLPDRRDLLEHIGDSAREYLANMRVEAECMLIGKNVEQAGLRRLPGLFLIEITRDERIIAPVEPDQVLCAGDRLTFTGVVSTIVDLERIPGLVVEEHHDQDEPTEDSDERRYCEAVVSGTSPIIGRNIRESNFRALYNAAVVAVHRGGTQLVGRVGDIVLRRGDTLLLQTGPHFVQAHCNNADFYLVSSVEDARPVRHRHAWLALGLLGLLVILLVTGWVPVVVAALMVAGLMILTGCISAGEARRFVQWDVLLAIAAALALGQALEKSGAAVAIADGIVGLTQAWGPVAALAAVYLTTIIFTEVISNAAAAALVFPLALSVAMELGVNPRAFAMAVIFGASFGFATPIGYQTHMMVFGPGGYKFTDFVRIGLPLDLLLGVLVVAMIPFIWPL
ncbi:MAG: SLC13 family permease [Planctomycetota bacterium]